MLVAIGICISNMAYSVNISVEAPIENQIQEIAYDGQEVYQT
jgi:mediator of RNA polymerase II transcription subunit 17